MVCLKYGNDRLSGEYRVQNLQIFKNLCYVCHLFLELPTDHVLEKKILNPMKLNYHRELLDKCSNIQKRLMIMNKDT